MAKKQTRKPGKPAATRKRAKARGTTRKRPAAKKTAGVTQRTAGRRPAAANTAGSGVVYTDLLREALAARTR
jgi:hypothetical protein